MVSHNFGKNHVRPKNKTTPPEIEVQTLWGISIKRLDAFRSKVNKMTLKESEVTKIIGYHLFRLPAAPPTITGRRGRTHGAKMVKRPARKEVLKRRESKDISLFFKN